MMMTNFQMSAEYDGTTFGPVTWSLHGDMTKAKWTAMVKNMNAAVKLYVKTPVDINFTDATVDELTKKLDAEEAAAAAVSDLEKAA